MGKFRDMLSQIIDVLVVSNRELSEEERAYLGEWQAKHVYNLVLSVLNLACLLMPISAELVYFMSPPPHHDPQFVTHVALSIIVIAGRAFHSKLRLYVRPLLLAGEVILAAGYAYTLHVSFSQDPDFNAIAFLSVLYVAIMIFTILLCPYPNGTVLGLAGLEAVMGGLAWSSARNLEPFDWMTIISAISIFAVGLFYARTYRTRSEALGELATRKLLMKDERNRIEKVERQLVQASEIQDSFSPHETMTTESGLKVSFFQEKYDLLGGDWSALRQLASGDVAIVVADATGKGIQAALVIHAIQTLWANSLANPTFDPLAWLVSANRTLIALGRRKDHTMSLGLIMMSTTTVTYYSAGHLPLFLVCGVGSERAVIPVVSRGNLLGLQENLVLDPQAVDLRHMSVQAVLLGTDGVFDRGVRTRKQFVISLADDLEATGTEALKQCMAADDKLVVLVKRAA